MQTVDTAHPKRESGNVVLVGMMGAGKTTVGKCLARQLGKVFVDSDDEIQRRTGVSIPHIFEVEGEEGFRRRESCAIHDLMQRNGLILATGGGAVILPQNRIEMSDNGVVVYLKGSVHELWQRTRHDRNRPLLQTADPRAKLQELLSQRDPLYTEVADLIVHTGRQGVQTLVAELIRKLGLQANNTQAHEPCKL
ncbi:Shikimate kinase 1 [Ferriphaselus amnicola]|uniref:Shikimate kinase n=1 Tax=Ferriphaselus amnicola TaxID=1188319 RepID=A0A2Z6GEE4_9PROT|nr:shikimate kinase [Ferriphaselus amnicola]BBE52001.1 Shikimate kinase 1 [Ferriphaselus amnicola]